MVTVQNGITIKIGGHYDEDIIFFNCGYLPGRLGG